MRPIMGRGKMRVISVGLCLGALLSAFGADADDDLTAVGQEVYDARCKTCHPAEREAGHGVGPNLFGVMGKPAGWSDSFRYSRAHRESDAVWDDATMDRYLEDVRSVVPKTLKGFYRLRRADDRTAVIAYLHTLR